MVCCTSVSAQAVGHAKKSGAPVVEIFFTADASRWSGAPLVKDKFGVYQTPLRSLETILKSEPLLEEAQVRDIRYEMGIGKPGALAWDQVTGTASQLRYDFSTFDALVTSWSYAGIQPLFAFTYCPLPLQPASNRDAWKDPPRSMRAWKAVNKAYAAHLRNDLHMEGAWFEQWNEPDLIEHGEKTFFTGSPEQYGQVFAYGAAGIRAGDQDARVGGPAAAYNLEYLSRAGLKTNPNTDFVSIHAYGNYEVQLDRLRSLVMNRPDLPLLLTEFASYPTFGIHAPISRHDAAAAFFANVDGLLRFQDTTKVYWAQWVDDDLGLITDRLHRKAIYNAYLLYQTMLPADRVAVIPHNSKTVGAMAGVDEHLAAIVVWNNGIRPVRVTVQIIHLPFHRGTVRQWFIDKDHASYLDGAQENLTAGGDWHEALRSSTAHWSGLVLPHSVSFVQASDDSEHSFLAPHQIGTFMRSKYWYVNRTGSSYADFDPRTSIARIGMGERKLDLAQIGNVYDRPSNVLRVQVKTQGRFTTEDSNSIFGIRIDFRDRSGGYTDSALYCNRICGLGRSEALPWGEKTALPDHIIRERRMESGREFTIRLSSIAPKDRDRNRIIITPILQDVGPFAKARIVITAGTVPNGENITQIAHEGLSMIKASQKRDR